MKLWLINVVVPASLLVSNSLEQHVDDEMVLVPYRRGSAYMEAYVEKDSEDMGSNQLAMCGRRG